MRKQVATTFRTILIVLAVVLLIITAVIYFIDTPVVEEGQEPTTAQKIILLGKKYLGEILLAFGVSGVALIGAFAKLIYNSAKRTAEESKTTSADMGILMKKNAEQEAKIAALEDLIKLLMKKQDITNNVLLNTFALSELPLSLREQIHNAQNAYSGLDKDFRSVERIADVLIKTAENKSQPPEPEDTERSKEENADVSKDAEEAKAPVYI